jgi:hypothetical protein
MQKKPFDKIQHSFIIKALMKVGLEGMYFKCNKSYIWQAYRQYYTKWEKTENSYSKVQNKTKLSTLSFLFNIDLEFLARAIRQEQEITGIQIGKEEVK